MNRFSMSMAGSGLSSKDRTPLQAKLLEELMRTILKELKVVYIVITISSSLLIIIISLSPSLSLSLSSSLSNIIILLLSSHTRQINGSHSA